MKRYKLQALNHKQTKRYGLHN